mgnify:CR=1 FL=1
MDVRSFSAGCFVARRLGTQRARIPVARLRGAHFLAHFLMHFLMHFLARLRARLGRRPCARRRHGFVEPPRIRERLGLGLIRGLYAKPGQDFQVAISKPMFCNENFCVYLREIGFPARAGNAGRHIYRNRPNQPGLVGRTGGPARCFCRFSTSSCPIRVCRPYCRPCRLARTGPGRGPACPRCPLPYARGSNSARRQACRRA